MKNLVTLGTCAYIFHWSNNNFLWGRESYKRKMEFRSRLYPLHEASEKDRTFEYVMRNGYMFVTIDGLEVRVTEMMAEHVEGEYPRKDIINGRTWKNPSDFISDKWRKLGRGWLHHTKLSSLGITMYDEGLMYYRMSFKYMTAEFIVSGGELYLRGSEAYVKTDATKICTQLCATSLKAERDITEILNFLTSVDK